MGINDLATTLKFFFTIAGELVLLFIGVTFLVSLLQEYLPPETIQKIMVRKRKWAGNILGAAFGAVTPFCSCSTIPIVIGLLNGGAPFGAAMSFLLASPLLNPIILALLWSMLGLKVMVFYGLLIFPLAAFLGGLWEKVGLASDYKRVAIRAGGSNPVSDACCTVGSCCAEQVDGATRIRFSRAGLSALSLFRQVFPYLILGAAIGALIYGLVPEDWITRVTSKAGLAAVPLAAVIGVPLYIRAETIIPIASVLTSKGMKIGAIMALIIGGAGASIPEVTLLAAIFKKRLVAVFVVTIIVIATLVGYTFDWLL
ncbi:MAG TPA: permease [Clostridia bacterium]|nr:permease [Clostridia bacterium]